MRGERDVRALVAPIPMSPSQSLPLIATSPFHNLFYFCLLKSFCSFPLISPCSFTEPFPLIATPLNKKGSKRRKGKKKIYNRRRRDRDWFMENWQSPSQFVAPSRQIHHVEVGGFFLHRSRHLTCLCLMVLLVHVDFMILCWFGCFFDVN